VCESEEVTVLLRDGPSQADFTRLSSRVYTRPPRPASYAECNNAQKRLMLYGVLHTIVYGGAEAQKGRRDPMPECIKHQVRTAFPRQQE
jgi:hypothetical protein